VVSDRSGCGLIELAVLESLAALTADDPERYIASARALSGIEDRIALGPRYSYQVLRELAYPWMMAAQLVAAMGFIGDRTPFEPAEAAYTEARQSHVGQLVLDAEAGRLPPVPVGLINGTTYRGGMQPPLEPFGVIAALRTLLRDPEISDAELLSTVGPPHSPAGCTLIGDLDGLVNGHETVIREAGRIAVTGVPVPEQPPPAPALTGGGGPFGWTGYAVARPVHLVIESLPAGSFTSEVTREILDRAVPREQGDNKPSEPDRGMLDDAVMLPIAAVDDQSEPFPTEDRHEPYPVKIGLILRPGSDPASVRQQLLNVHGIWREATWAFPAPLASMLRSWLDNHRGENLIASLDQLEHAIGRDRSRELQRE
jgi:hypothetical protein